MYVCILNIYKQPLNCFIWTQFIVHFIWAHSSVGSCTSSPTECLSHCRQYVKPLLLKSSTRIPNEEGSRELFTTLLGNLLTVRRVWLTCKNARGFFHINLYLQKNWSFECGKSFYINYCFRYESWWGWLYILLVK